ncbi:hypothetical protein [Marinilactibacillus kalidii]|uniref:hypothetical protein n=1 Tax=Marinilactibacillus kalidii TaxID=2820274 RepID=UPI001ABDF9FE|nr:hypothetical protein [Marinilactibacillus kalidii]
MSRKKRTTFEQRIFRCLLLVMGIFLTACQQNDFFVEETSIVKIDILDQKTDRKMATVTDDSFIQSLIKELGTAQTSDTANMDIMSPDYQLVFIDNEGTVVKEIGYYIEVKNFGVSGRYQVDGEHIAVTTELPIEF